MSYDSEKTELRDFHKEAWVALGVISGVFGLLWAGAGGLAAWKAKFNRLELQSRIFHSEYKSNKEEQETIKVFKRQMKTYFVYGTIGWEFIQFTSLCFTSGSDWPFSTNSTTVQIFASTRLLVNGIFLILSFFLLLMLYIFGGGFLLHNRRLKRGEEHVDSETGPEGESATALLSEGQSDTEDKPSPSPAPSPSASFVSSFPSTRTGRSNSHDRNGNAGSRATFYGNPSTGASRLRLRDDFIPITHILEEEKEKAKQKEVESDHLSLLQNFRKIYRSVAPGILLEMLLIPMLSISFALLSCDYSDVDSIHLHQYSDIKCWTSFHVSLVVLSSLVIVCVYPSSLKYALIRNDDEPEFWRVPRWDVVFIMIKYILTMCTSLYQKQVTPLVLLIFLCFAFLMLGNFLLQPYLGQRGERVNHWRNASFCGVLWCASINVFVLINNDADSFIAFFLLILYIVGLVPLMGLMYRMSAGFAEYLNKRAILSIKRVSITSSPEDIRKATLAVAKLSLSDDNRYRIAEHGVLPHLVLILGADDPEAVATTCWALNNLAFRANIREQLVIDGAVEKCGEVILRNDPPEVRHLYIYRAVGLLGNLVGQKKSNEILLNIDGLVEKLVELTELVHVTPEVNLARNLARVLNNTAACQERQKQQLVESGILNGLFRLLRVEDEQCEQHALSALANMAFTPDIRSYMMSHNIVTVISKHLRRSPSLALRKEAARLAGHLCLSPEHRALVGKSTVKAIVSLGDLDDRAVILIVLRALTNMIRANAVDVMKATVPLMELHQASEDPELRRLALRGLAFLRRHAIKIQLAEGVTYQDLENALSGDKEKEKETRSRANSRASTRAPSPLTIADGSSGVLIAGGSGSVGATPVVSSRASSLSVSTVCEEEEASPGQEPYSAFGASDGESTLGNSDSSQKRGSSWFSSRFRRKNASAAKNGENKSEAEDPEGDPARREPDESDQDMNSSGGSLNISGSRRGLRPQGKGVRSEGEGETSFMAGPKPPQLTRRASDTSMINAVNVVIAKNVMKRAVGRRKPKTSLRTVSPAPGSSTLTPIAPSSRTSTPEPESAQNRGRSESVKSQKLSPPHPTSTPSGRKKSGSGSADHLSGSAMGAGRKHKGSRDAEQESGASEKEEKGKVAMGTRPPSKVEKKMKRSASGSLRKPPASPNLTSSDDGFGKKLPPKPPAHVQSRSHLTISGEV